MLNGTLAASWWAGAVAALTIAMAKDRSPLAWLLPALIAGPFAAALLVLLPSTGLYAAIKLDPEAMELCDDCLEPVRRDRTRCRYCGSGAT